MQTRFMRSCFTMIWALALSVGTALTAMPASAQNAAAPKEGTWIVKDFRFHTGEMLPELRLHYTTLGDPKNEAVLVLHGTTGQAKFWKQHLVELLQTAPRLGK